MIDTSGWHEFRIGDLFEVSRPSSRSANKYDKGTMPFVASGNFNNGVTDYLAPKDENDYDEENCITVSAVDGYAFYQKDRFLGRGGAGSSIMMLRNDNLNELNGKYLCTLIRTACGNWNYANMGNKDKLADTMIWLPITSLNEPDWQYMTDYMQLILNESHKDITKLNEVDNIKQAINTKSWKKFHLYDGIFDIDMGTKLDKTKMHENNPTVNFVGRANANNGITTCVDEIEGIKPYKAGYMTLSLGGEYLGSCFVQPKPFYTSQNVVVLIPTFDMSDNIKRFLGTVIFKESRLHYKAFIDELNRHIKTDFEICLPVTSDGTPDWQYMEDYMQQIMEKSEQIFSDLQMTS